MLTSFDPLEQAAIAIGSRDPIAHQAPGGRLARLFGAIFGRATAPPLANARLEALRRLVVALRQPGKGDATAVADALEAGLAPADIETLMRDLGIPTR